MNIKYLLIFVLILSGCTTGQVIKEESELEGPYLVTKVVDGDTLDVLINNQTERIRVSGINTPETGECYYQQAKEKLAELTLNKKVYIEKDITDRGKYGRLLRYVYVNNNLVNGILVEEGFAKVYDKYKEDTKKYEELKLLEKNAITSNLGVWSCVDNKKDCLYVGSKNSDKYYPPTCKYAKRIKPENLQCYNSEQEVKNLMPAKGC